MSAARTGDGAAKGQVGRPVPRAAAIIQYEWDAAWVIVAYGEYDIGCVASLAEALEIASKKYSKVVVDASRLTFADSAFLNLLLRANSTTALRVAEPAPQLRRMLRLTGADSVLDVRESVEEAAAS